MGRKVFISFLGTNDYVECHYEFPDGDRSRPVRFIQEALVEALCRGWDGETDKIFIFCTAAATKYNWEDGGQPKNQQAEGLKRRLQEALSRLELPAAMVEKADIPEGFSEKEIWEIFTAVYDKLAEGDEIYFDITHAFRFIPMLTTVLFNYAQAMKHTTVAAINYGAFEKLGPARNVNMEMPLAERVAPVLELKSIVDLQLYTEAAGDLEKFGNVKRLTEVIPDSRVKQPQILEEFANATNKLIKNIAVNGMDNIKKGTDIRNIRDSWKNAKKQDIATPVRNIMEKLVSYIENFEVSDSYKNVEAAVLWDIKYQMFPQAYTMLQEYTVSRACDKLKRDFPSETQRFAQGDDDKELRMFVSDLLAIEDKDLANPTGLLQKYNDFCNLLLQDPFIKQLRPIYHQLAVARNEINHAKKSSQPDVTKRCNDLQSKLKESFVQITALINRG